MSDSADDIWVTVEETVIVATIAEGDVDVIVESEETVVVTVATQGPPGPPGEPGQQGDPGPPSPDIGGTFTYEQDVPSATWVIVHGLGFFPNVAVVDTLGRAFLGEVTYDDLNQVTVRFATAVTGSAHLS